MSPPKTNVEITEDTRVNLTARNAFYILVSAVMAVGAILGVWYSGKNDIEKLWSESKLMIYRIEQLEKKIEQLEKKQK